MKTCILLPVVTSVVVSCSVALGADVREGLVAYWPLNSTSGGFPVTTPDVVGGNDLAGIDMDVASAVVSGRFGNAIAFDGVQSYLTYQALPEADSGLPISRQGSWTMALWVKAPSQPAGNYYLVESSSLSGTPLTAFTARANSGSTAVYVRDASGNNPVNMPAVADVSLDDTWHHVAMTYDADSHAFTHYVDGNAAYTTSYVPNYANNALYDLVTLGARSRNGTIDLFFQGAVDDVALWARALSPAEIQEVKTNSLAVPVPRFAPVITQHPANATNLFAGDSVTLTTFGYGSRPLTYRWQKNGVDVAGATTANLAFTDATPADSGLYRVIVANDAGSATSVVAQVTVNAFSGPNLTNGLVALWPLDAIVGVKTPDLVSAYDLTVHNMGSSNVVEGKWGQALAFDKTASQFARRIHNPGDALPAYARSNFTVSFWAKALPASGGWAFAEASTLGNNPAFCMGMLNNSASLDGFVRSNAGQPAGDHRLSSTPVWDDTWHNVVWVQRDVGGAPKATLYIDGVQDGAGNLNPVYPVTPNNTALASFARATPGQFFTGSIDEVAIWERPLSAEEVALLQTGPITNPPSRLTPLVVNAFKSDLPAVATGDAVALRWDVPANATQVQIEPLGDVTALTASGIGSTNVTLTSTTTFVLTVKRGTDLVTATNTVRVVDGIASGWSLLDNFDAYPAGLLGANGWWIDMYASSAAVVLPNGANRMVKTTLNPSGAYLRLGGLAIAPNESRTLFFRMIPQANPLSVLRQIVGITDKAAQFFYQLEGNTGPVILATANDAAQAPGAWVLAARNGPGSAPTFDASALEAGAVYSVWIDVTNVPLDDRGLEDADIFSVHLQKEGDAERTTLFADFVSDRDLDLDDSLTGGLPTDPLARLYIGSNSETDSALFDDFYLSKSGLLSTVPRPFGYSGGAETPLAIRRAGSQVEVVWGAGVLQEASVVTGVWTDVPGASAPSYLFTPTQEARYFRTRSGVKP